MNRDDELLASYVAGELSDDSVEIRELFARRPDARAAATELSALTRELDAGGALERRMIAAARAQVSDADRARLAGIAQARQSAVRRVVVTRWVAAAALVVTAVGIALLVQRRPAAEPGVQVLNGDRDAHIALRSPQAPLSADVPLEWDASPLSASERFALEFRAVDGAGSTGKLLRRLRCASASWTPSTADLSDWPEQVTLVISRVEVDNAGRELAVSQPFSLRVAR